MGLNIVEYLSINEFNEKSFESYNIRIKSNDIKLLKSNLMLNGYLGLWEKGISPLFFSKIAKCNVSTLLLYCDLKLTIREFEILTKTGNIKEINFSMNIFYDDGSKVPLEVLLLHVPKAVDISFSRYNIPKNSLKKLLLMERKVKLEAFRLLRLTQLPDLDLLNAFLKKNLVDRGIVKVFFETEEMDKQFLPQIWKTFSTWEPENLKKFFLFNLLWKFCYEFKKLKNKFLQKM
uniref:Uncharacterized protein n=1 Tax=Panagrolaimus sp. PS1159 TaxID=55785 RepID=A0AC35GL87_9BILA